MSDLSLDQDLLRILCCPACRRDLDYDWSVPELSCLRYRHTYPILDGIPIPFPVDVKSKLHEAHRDPLLQRVEYQGLHQTIRMNPRWPPVFDAPFKWLGSEN